MEAIHDTLTSGLTHQYWPERQLAVEQQLRDALDRAWAEYANAPRDERTNARELYLAALRLFAEFVTHHSGGLDPTALGSP
jgi:hypothetical protein